jgi:4-carboxymuconolactone decarboxylase
VSGAGPRIAPLPKEEWTDESIGVLRGSFGEAAADRFLATGPEAPPIPNVLATMVKHPTLAAPFLVYNGVLLNAPAIEPRWRELMILRVAWRGRSQYEWVQHVRIARACGITDEEIDAIARGAEAGTWSPLDAALLTATDECLDGLRISDGTWAELAAQLDERQLLEVVFVIGTYACLAMLFNSVGLELDPGLDAIGAPPLPESSA